MDAINGIGGNIYCTLETESHIRTPEVIVNRLGQGDYVQALLAQKICCLVSSVTAQNHQTIQL